MAKLEGLGKFDPKGLMGGAGQTLASVGTLLHGTGDMEADERGATIGGAVGGGIGMVAQSFIPIPGLGETIGQIGTIVGGLAGKGKARRDAAAEAAAAAGRTYGAFHEQANVDPYGAGNSAYMEYGGIADMGLSMFMLNTQLPVKATVNPLDTKLMVKHGTVPGSEPDMDMFQEIETMARGGIHIKKANRGKFTAWAKSHNMSVQEAANKVMKNKGGYSSTIVKRANFARNANKWKKAEGGLAGLDEDVGGGDDPVNPKKPYNPNVYNTPQELNAANQQARADALRKINPDDPTQKWLAENTVVGRNVGDPKVKYVGDVGRTTINRATTLPPGITIDMIENTSEGYGYFDPHEYTWKPVDPGAIYGRYGAMKKPAGSDVAMNTKQFAAGGAVDDTFDYGGGTPPVAKPKYKPVSAIFDTEEEREKYRKKVMDIGYDIESGGKYKGLSLKNPFSDESGYCANNITGVVTKCGGKYSNPQFGGRYISNSSLVDAIAHKREDWWPTTSPKVGDHISYYNEFQSKHTGHSKMVYDIINDENGKPKTAKLITGSTADGYHVQDVPYDELAGAIRGDKRYTKGYDKVYAFRPGYKLDKPKLEEERMAGMKPEVKKAVIDKRDFTQFETDNSPNFKYQIREDSPYAKDAPEGLTKVMNWANDEANINRMVKNHNVSKSEVHDEILNVIGQLGVENKWRTAPVTGVGLGTALENAFERVTARAKNSIGPGQIRFNDLDPELKKTYGIKKPRDLFDYDKVIPLMVAINLKNRQWMRNQGENMSDRLIGQPGVKADDLKGGIGRWTPYVYRGIPTNPGKRLIKEYKKQQGVNDVFGAENSQSLDQFLDENMRSKALLNEEGSYADKVFHAANSVVQRTSPTFEQEKELQGVTVTSTKKVPKRKLGGMAKDYDVYAMGGIVYSDDEVPSMKSGGWIKKAVNPKHKGYCTPMTKATCTPRRKALARTFKKHHGFHHKAEGGDVVDYNQNEEGVYEPANDQDQGQEQQEQGAPQQAQAQAKPKTSIVNIERGELAVDKSGAVLKEFNNPSRYFPHSDSPMKEPSGNFVTLPDDVIIIPKKLAKGYKQGNKLTQSSMLRQILMDQMKRKAAGQEDYVPQAAEGGYYGEDPNPSPFGYMPGVGFVPTVNAARVPNTNAATVFGPGGPTGMDDNGEPLIGYVPGVSAPRTVGRAPIAGVGTIGQGINQRLNAAGIGAGPQPTSPVVSATSTPNPLSVWNNNASNPRQDGPHGVTGGGVTDPKAADHPGSSWLGAVQGLQFLPAGLQLLESFKGNPDLVYDDNKGFGEARGLINAMPTDVNYDAAKAEVGRTVNARNRALMNFRRPDVAGEMATNYGEGITRVGQIEQDEYNQEQQARGNKLGALGDLAIKEGADKLAGRKELSLEKQQDAAAKRNMRYSAISESVGRFAKNFMDEEKIKAGNEMADLFYVDPHSKELVMDKEKAKEYWLNQLNSAFGANLGLGKSDVTSTMNETTTSVNPRTGQPKSRSYKTRTYSKPHKP